MAADDQAASQKSAETTRDVRRRWQRNRMSTRGTPLARKYIATLGQVISTRDFSASCFLASSALRPPGFFRFVIIIDTLPDFFTTDSAKKQYTSHTHFINSNTRIHTYENSNGHFLHCLVIQNMNICRVPITSRTLFAWGLTALSTQIGYIAP